MKREPFFEVRRERQTVRGCAALRILYLSDLHFTGRSGNAVRSIGNEIDVLDPSLVLLGGDYADSGRGLYWFARLMERLAQRPVLAVAGNHDYLFGVKKISKVVTAFNGHWIEKASAKMTVNGTTVHIDGNGMTEPPPDAVLTVLCLHKPMPVADVHRYHLVFAGHLHGGQIVLWQTPEGLFPGKLFYRQNFLRRSLAQGSYFVSKGLGDTLPFRYHCNHDMVLVDVGSESDAG